ncbi:MAG: class I SAM-dependent methyltransferase [Candidatus Coatesbacteria bacterium]
MRFEHFDRRNYTTLPVTAGYRRWSEVYDRQLRSGLLEFPLLRRMQGVAFGRVRTALDLACGTGRIGAWLKTKGVKTIDGVDLSPHMIAQAKRKKVYRAIRRGDLTTVPLPRGGYDLSICVLAACHMKDLAPLYRQMARATRPGGIAVLVDYHPHFLLNGIPTHFPDAAGKTFAIENHVHLLADHFRAARRAGWTLTWLDELVVARSWLRSYPGWRKFLGHPVSFSMAWTR